MAKKSFPLKLPMSVKAAPERLAREDGVTLDLWISTAVAQKVGAVESAADFFSRKAGDSVPADLLPFLNEAADEAPAPGDELPESSRP